MSNNYLESICIQDSGKLKSQHFYKFVNQTKVLETVKVLRSVDTLLVI